MAGFQRFDPDRWEPEREGGEAAKAAKPAKVDGVGGDTFATLATLASGAVLPGTVGAGVAALDEARPPRGVPAEPWRVVVRDAQRLVSQGWAAQALGLGWSELDLFGAVTDKLGDPAADGLAVQLDGRRVLALCASFATVADANGKRSYFYRRDNEGARLLWALGRGR
jgi:hypothetical protein